MEPFAPRILEVDLDALEAGAEPPRVRAWRPVDPVLDRLASWGGTALGLALLAREPAPAPAGAGPLVLAVGQAVRRALPTAGRASVLARAPLTGLLAEGHVGGSLGPALAWIADALVLSGRARRPGAVLRLGSDGTVALESHPALAGAEPAAVWRVLGTAPDAAVLRVGPAGERGLPFASLASGGERPSFVGRGGLGAVLGALGLKAVVVEEGPGEPAEHEDARELLHALTASPRLAARAEGGTLELVDAFAVRGDLRARNYDEPVAPEEARALGDEARARGVSRSGCRGCPTPCGWTFERSDGEKQRAHFSASYALGTNLGLFSFDDALALLAACDRTGVDAKEVGALLALLARAQERGLVPGEPIWGERERLVACIEALAADGGDELTAALRGGARAFARAVGLEDELTGVRGMAARPEANLAAVLGQCVSTGGADPMRSFPFLVDAADRDRLEDLCADVGPLPDGAGDPSRPAGKGRLVYWHENLVAAVDATGFCAFSTAGLLADGVCDLDTLAGWILPAALCTSEGVWSALPPGRRLLAAGANLVLLRRELDRRYGAAPDADRPAWARERLALPGMLDEYTALRGLDGRGAPTPERLAALGTPDALARPETEDAPAESPARPAPSAGAVGRVELRALGPLGEVLGAGGGVELPLPTTVLEVLRGAADADARLGRHLLDGERPIPAVWRAGARLQPDAEVHAGDVLDLVTAISGG
jgi:aldehyde:ferredoxin oxidoreductase